MSEHEAVVEANREFYRAFESLDLEQMEKVWLKDRQIVCIHPGWRKLSGWGPVMQSWERIFESVFEMNFEVGEVDVILDGDLAVIVVEENLTQRGYDGSDPHPGARDQRVRACRQPMVPGDASRLAGDGTARIGAATPVGGAADGAGAKFQVARIALIRISASSGRVYSGGGACPARSISRTLVPDSSTRSSSVCGQVL